MKRIGVFILVLLMLVVFFVPQTFAVGPLMVEAHTATWDANTEPDLAGYYLYWRPVTTPVTAWNNTQRVQIVSGPNIVKTYDLTLSIIINGAYQICVTAYDTAGNESGLSNIVPFPLDLPGAPRNTRVQ
jgi:hypothetical protein